MARTSEADKIKQAKELLIENGYELIPEQSIKCCDCGSTKTVNQSGNYYASTSDRHKSCTALHRPAKGNRKTAPKPVIRSYVPYCGNCLIKDKDFNNVSDFVDTLSLMDKPFIKSIYDKNMTKHDDKNSLATLGRYCKDLALNHSECHFKDSDNWVVDIDDKNEESQSAFIADITEEDMNRLNLEWGHLPLGDLIYLENEYIDWEGKYDLDTKSIQFLVKQICNLQLIIKKKIEKNQDVQKELKTIQDLMTSSALKPVQESAAMSAEYNTLGTWAKKFENEKPFSGVLDEYKDVDGIKKLIKIFFLGHMCKMLNVQGDISEEYEIEMSKYTVSVDEEDDYVD